MSLHCFSFDESQNTSLHSYKTWQRFNLAASWKLQTGNFQIQWHLLTFEALSTQQLAGLGDVYAERFRKQHVA